MGPLEDIRIVLTGIFEGFENNREKLESVLKGLGARVTGSVSSKTNYLVHGFRLDEHREDFTEGTKYKKAISLGTKILDINELNNIINEKTGKSID